MLGRGRACCHGALGRAALARPPSSRRRRRARSSTRRAARCGTVKVSPSSSTCAGAGRRDRTSRARTSRAGSRARRRAVVDPRRSTLPFFSSASLTSNRSAKSQSASIRTVEVDRLVVVVEDRELLAEAVADGALADHRQLRVDVDRARARHEEEARLEVLQVVDRQRVRAAGRRRSAPTSRGSGCRTRTVRSGRSATPRCRRARR